MQDIIVKVSLDTSPRPVETLMPLILGLEGAVDYGEYTSLADLTTDHASNTDVYKAAAAMLAQADLTGAPIAKFAAIGLASDSAASAVTAALTTLRSTHDDWYYLVPADATSDIVTALAAWAEATVLTDTQLAAGAVEAEKLLVAQQSAASTTITKGQTVLCYNTDADTYMHAAWVGRMAGCYPQAPTWKWKELVGIEPESVSGAALTTLLGLNLNTYVLNHKRRYMRDGVCTDGEYIDAVIGRWRIKQLLREAVTNLAVDTDQIPYNDAGFTAVGAAVISALSQAATDGIIATVDGTPQITITIPDASDATDAQRSSRTMPPITWSATLTGSIHGTKVTGTLSVALTA